MMMNPLLSTFGSAAAQGYGLRSGVVRENFILANVSSLNEGEAVTFTYYTLNNNEIPPPGSNLYWSLNGANITASDFVENVSNGVFTHSVTRISPIVTLTAREDQTFFETDETFTLSVRRDSTNGTVLANSSPIIIADTSNSAFDIYANVTAVNETNTRSIGFTVNTKNTANGNVLFWTINSLSGNVLASDFDVPNNRLDGNVTINSNTGSFSVVIKQDALTEGTETFNVQLRTASNTGTIVDTSNTITISDTSTTALETLILAGGGSGTGKRGPGGGGAGGLLYYGPSTTQKTPNGPSLTPTTYAVGIGAGAPTTFGTDGQATTFGPAITATGGGGGGRPGGSGGGNNGAGTGSPGQTTFQGFSGGPTGRGGGGGAGQAGFGTSADPGGTGGNGLNYTMFGGPNGSPAGWFGGGGGGGGANPGSWGAGGGQGGGGPGGPGNARGSNAVANTGGGGGANGDLHPKDNGNYAGAGGSGIVIVSYAGSPAATGGTISTTNRPGFTNHVFTGSGTFTWTG